MGNVDIYENLDVNQLQYIKHESHTLTISEKHFYI